MKFFLPLLLLFLFSCKKDNSCSNCEENVNAVVVWAGDIRFDGCDWCIQTDSSHLYHPDGLSAEFKYDQLAVTMSYELTREEFHCGFGVMPVIHITEIRK